MHLSQKVSEKEAIFENFRQHFFQKWEDEHKIHDYAESEKSIFLCNEVFGAKILLGKLPYCFWEHFFPF